MKFKFELDRKTLIRFACIILILALLPFSFELAFLIDLGGIDFAITFLMLFLASSYHALLDKWETFKSDLRAFFVFLAQLYMFKPRIFVSHATASGIILTLTSCLFLACLFWIPLMYVSSGYLV